MDSFITLELCITDAMLSHSTPCVGSSCDDPKLSNSGSTIQSSLPVDLEHTSDTGSDANMGGLCVIA
ncbi:hypothetical protein GYMLUDRAFT_262332 [Collybiopsis luxurians FD-317 M1]|uniref:Pheromone n=1 Tax=Collybiopsis luxurians FD-317 M1 TaxID=944289 RepID=A0A0D0BTK1_9AGAR|nr:hypothetical protein GYMLUDRAFT_262332 [Collybiopsis luxurians FD-317 M1]